MTERLGDAPIDPKHHEMMNKLAVALDRILNADVKPKENGFILIVFPFENVKEGGRANYISNANRKDVVIMLKEQIKRFEGQPEMKGHG
jgi:TolB-like protein